MDGIQGSNVHFLVSRRPTADGRGRRSLTSPADGFARRFRVLYSFYDFPPITLILMGTEADTNPREASRHEGDKRVQTTRCQGQ